MLIGEKMAEKTNYQPSYGMAEVVVLKCVFYHGQKRLKQAEVASSWERWWYDYEQRE